MARGGWANRVVGACAVAVALAASLLGAPGASASAAAEPEEPPLGSTRSNPFPSPGAFYVRGSNGYFVSVYTEPPRGKEPAKVWIAAADRDSEVSYGVAGNLAGEGIRANFGRFGRVEMRWQPSGRVAKRTVRCHTYRYNVFVAEGSYVGMLRFHGPRSFATAAAHRVSGRKGWFALRGCELRSSGGFPGPGETLAAERRKSREPKGSERYVTAVQNGPGEKVTYEAADREEVGRLSIRRFAAAVGGPKTIRFDPSFASASVRPPLPFHGSGEFQRREHARGSWRGDLSVDFPDKPGVPLAGDDFEAIFHSGFFETESLMAPAPVSRWPD